MSREGGGPTAGSLRVVRSALLWRATMAWGSTRAPRRVERARGFVAAAQRASAHARPSCADAKRGERASTWSYASRASRGPLDDADRREAEPALGALRIGRGAGPVRLAPRRRSRRGASGRARACATSRRRARRAEAPPRAAGAPLRARPSARCASPLRADRRAMPAPSPRPCRTPRGPRRSCASARARGRARGTARGRSGKPLGELFDLGTRRDDVAGRPEQPDEQAASGHVVGVPRETLRKVATASSSWPCRTSACARTVALARTHPLAASVPEPLPTTASASVMRRRARGTAPTNMTADDDTRCATGAIVLFAFAAHKFILAARPLTVCPLMNKD